MQIVKFIYMFIVASSLDVFQTHRSKQSESTIYLICVEWVSVCGTCEFHKSKGKQIFFLFSLSENEFRFEWRPFCRIACPSRRMSFTVWQIDTQNQMQVTRIVAEIIFLVN